MEAADDPWTSVTTSSGAAADEIISALQKSIRRGDVENAALCARDMIETSPSLEDYLWLRLRVIAVEDVGPAVPLAIVMVSCLDESRQLCSTGGHDRFLMAAAAVRLLAESPKDRSNDELASITAVEVERSARRPRIDDVMLDMHTRRGQEMGRDLTHFLLHASHVENEAANRDRTWQERLHHAVGVRPES